MSEEILINVTPRETRVALVENGVLQEIFIERARRRGLGFARQRRSRRTQRSTPFIEIASYRFVYRRSRKF